MNLYIFDVGEMTPLSDTLRPWFDEVGRALSGRDYGGPMEHLWIEVQVHEYGINIPDRAPWPFRFQKRVSPRSLAGLGPSEPKMNVGHYAVRPSFEEMRADSQIEAARQVLAVVQNSTACLAGKRQLRGFDLKRFQKDLADAFAVYCLDASEGHSLG